MNQSVSRNHFLVVLVLVTVFAYLLGGSMTEPAGAASLFDKNFGSNGRVETNVTFKQVDRSGRVQDIKTLADGKFVAAVTFDNEGGSLTVLRFRPDGTLDPTFGKSGLLQPGFGAALEFFDDGAFVIADELGAPNASKVVGIARYLPDGSPDRSFGDNGQTVKGDFEPGYVSDLTIASNGKILLEVFDGKSHGSSQLALFSSAGKRLIQTGMDHNTLSGITAADDGTFRAFDNETHDLISISRSLQVDFIRHFGETELDWGGPILMLPGNDFYGIARSVLGETSVVKVKSDGSLDPSFGTGGKVSCESEPSAYNSLESLAFDSRGRILVRGFSAGCSLFRVLPAEGTLDPTFGDQGILAADPNGGFAGEPIVTTGDRILFGDWNGDRLDLSRLNEDGSPDLAFGQKKVPILQVTADSARDVIRTPKGLVVGGNSNCSYYVEALGCFGFGLIRYRENGALDRTFGEGGRAFGDYMTVQSLTRLRGGKILTAGGSTTRPGFVVARFTAAGKLDPSFGVDGVARAPLPTRSVRFAVALDTDVQKNGKIVVTGEALSNRGGVAEYLPVMLFNADGTLDSSFSGDGILELSLTDLERGAAIKALDGGRILIAGRDHFDAMVLRLKPNGELDQSFGKNGISKPKLPVRARVGKKVSFSPERAAGALAILPNGSMIVGAADGYGVMDGIVFKLSRQGRLIRTFGKRGLAFTAGLTPQDITIDRCQRLTISGGNRKTLHAGVRFGVLRLRSGGGADRSFNRGRTVLPFGGVDRSNASAATISKGRVIVAGTASRHRTHEDFALAGFSAQKKCK